MLKQNKLKKICSFIHQMPFVNLNKYLLVLGHLLLLLQFNQEFRQQYLNKFKQTKNYQCDKNAQDIEIQEKMYIVKSFTTYFKLFNNSIWPHFNKV